MNSGDLQFLQQRYLQLQQQYNAGQLSWEQLAAQVGKLQIQDGEGNWWTVDPRSGSFLRYDGAQWVTDEPLITSSQPPPSPSVESPPDGRKGIMTVVGFLGIILPLITSCCWFSYASLTPSSEGWDLLTPFILAGIPIALIFFQKPIDRLLMPIQPIRHRLPNPLLLGATMALPFVIGCACTSMTDSGYGAMRFALIVGMLSAHIITRQPEVES
jgi:hypothetical protein